MTKNQPVKRGRSNNRSLDAMIMYVLARFSHPDKPLTVAEISELLRRNFDVTATKTTVYLHLCNLRSLTQRIEQDSRWEELPALLVRQSGSHNGPRKDLDETYGWYVEPILSSAEATLMLAGIESAGVSSIAWEGLSERLCALAGKNASSKASHETAVTRRERIASLRYGTFIQTIGVLVDSIEHGSVLRLKDEAYKAAHTAVGNHIARGTYVLPLRLSFLNNGILYLVGVVFDSAESQSLEQGCGLYVLRVDHIELLVPEKQELEELKRPAKALLAHYQDDLLTSLLGTKVQPDYNNYDIRRFTTVEIETNQPELVRAFFGARAVMTASKKRGDAAVFSIKTTEEQAIGWLLQYGYMKETRVLKPASLRKKLANIGSQLMREYGT